MIPKQKNAQLVPIFFAFYSKMVKNFILYHLINSLIFIALSFGLSFVFFKTSSEGIDKTINTESDVIFITIGLTTAAIGYIFPYLSFDKVFLKENLSKRSYHFLRFCQHYVLSMVVVAGLGVIPVAMGLLTLKVFLIIPVLMMPISVVAPLLLEKLHQKTQSKYMSRVFEKHWAFVSKKITASVGLNFLYFLRKNKRNLIKGVALVVLVNLCIVGYLINNQGVGQVGLLVIPFIVSLLYAVNINTKVYGELAVYTGSHKKTGFLADCLFWLALLFIQWLLTLVGLLAVNLEALSLFSLILLGMPFFVFYCLVLKFKYLESRVLRLLSLGLSVVLPFIIPFLLFLFFVEIKDD